jgi:hypothetical protein
VRNAEDELSEREEEREAERLPGVLVIETGGRDWALSEKKLGTPNYHQRFVFKTKAKRFTGKFHVIIIFHGETKKHFFVFFKGETPMIKRIFDDLFIFFWIVGVMPGSSEPGSTSGKSPGHVQSLYQVSPSLIRFS